MGGRVAQRLEGELGWAGKRNRLSSSLNTTENDPGASSGTCFVISPRAPRGTEHSVI